MLELLKELPDPYIPAESQQEDCPFDWAIGRDPDCYRHTQNLCYDYMQGKNVEDKWDMLPYAEAKEGDYLIIYHEDLPFPKSIMKAYFCFHYLKPWLDKFEYIAPWKINYEGQEYGLGLYTPDIGYSFFSKSEEDLKRNRVWAMKNMILTTQKYSETHQVINLAASVSNCKKMNEDYHNARRKANTDRFGRYIAEFFEPIWEVRWESQRHFSYKKALALYELN